MHIVTVRRISQVFFLVVFLWLCVVTTLGSQWWQLRGWPINWILSLDPLTAVATALATGTLFAPLLWAVPVLLLTVVVGRFFCGFACPLGTLNQAVGWLSRLGQQGPQRVEANRLRRAQSLKYYLLALLLALALAGSVQTGLFDPLPLLHRSVNLALVPLADPGLGILYEDPPSYASTWLIGGLLLAILGLNMVVPRFFCRFICPLGALMGLTARFSPWRIGKTTDNCGTCHICEQHCEGACRPSAQIVTGECVMCMNCLGACPAKRLSFNTKPSAAGETHLPDLSRRGVMAAGAGILLAPWWRVGALAGTNRDASLIRPPGSLDENRFLARCIRCGQCMRVCPGNIVQPATLEAGVQGVWTPTINYRIGRSGCQPNCIACGQVCPTAAIRPFSLEEKQGTGDFEAKGPIRLGTAFVDRTRCLPWAMDRPCLVCHELCPVSPKAIFTRTTFELVRDGQSLPAKVLGLAVDMGQALPQGVNLGTGDYYLRPAGAPETALRRVVSQSGSALSLERAFEGDAGGKVDIVVRLQRPFVDPAKCIGCGMCEHECPVSGLRAIRVYSENESRSRSGRMLL